MSINSETKARIKQQEGSIDHMYLDTRGYVTVGVGHLLAKAEDAAELSFVHRDTGLEATRGEILNEYQSLREQQSGLIASKYRQYTKLMLPEEKIDALLEHQINYFVDGLSKELTGYNNFPGNAQEGLLDMAFNLGLHGLVQKFPTMVAAAKQQDWNVCAEECHRTGIGEERNQQTMELFKQASVS